MPHTRPERQIRFLRVDARPRLGAVGDTALSNLLHTFFFLRCALYGTHTDIRPRRTHTHNRCWTVFREAKVARQEAPVQPAAVAAVAMGWRMHFEHEIYMCVRASPSSSSWAASSCAPIVRRASGNVPQTHIMQLLGIVSLSHAHTSSHQLLTLSTTCCAPPPFSRYLLFKHR